MLTKTPTLLSYQSRAPPSPASTGDALLAQQKHHQYPNQLPTAVAHNTIAAKPVSYDKQQPILAIQTGLVLWCKLSPLNKPKFNHIITKARNRL